MSDTTGVIVSGHCERCTWDEQYVFHDTPWCPRFPAVCVVDWNAARFEANDSVLHEWTMAKFFSRPVTAGEVVVLYCNDGDHMATFGVVEDRPGRPGEFQVREIAHVGPWATMIYAAAPSTEGKQT